MLRVRGINGPGEGVLCECVRTEASPSQHVLEPGP